MRPRKRRRVSDLGVWVGSAVKQKLDYMKVALFAGNDQGMVHAVGILS